MDIIDHSKNYAGEPQAIQAEEFIGNTIGSHTWAIVVPTNVPASAWAAGVTWEVVRGDWFVYVCVATDTRQRVAIATWA